MGRPSLWIHLLDLYLYARSYHNIDFSIKTGKIIKNQNPRR